MSCRRLDELDALRGVALGMMLLSNFVSDLDFFGAMTVAAGDGWWWFSRLTGGLFVAVAGVAAFLASRKGGTRQALHRSLKLAGIAYGITLVTWLALPHAFVRFGVLHLLALAGLVALPLRGRERLALPVGAACLLLPWLALPAGEWLGLRGYDFTTVDYFPLKPWLGVFLLAFWASSRAYADGRPLLAREWPALLLWAGRRTLPIYLLHQPLLVGALLLVGL
jgi:uncharacterized membrane protein